MEQIVMAVLAVLVQHQAFQDLVLLMLAVEVVEDLLQALVAVQGVAVLEQLQVELAVLEQQI
jgi:uncharacterized protein YejL (UPF0352 family)